MQTDLNSGSEIQLQKYVDRRLESIIRKNEEFEMRIEMQIAKHNTKIADEPNSKGETAAINPTMDIHRIEEAINEWTKSIEDQLNVLLNDF